MFEVIDKLPFSEATQIVHYAINEIQNPHVMKKGVINRMSAESRQIANKLIREAKVKTSENEYVNVLYNKLIEMAGSNDLYDKDRGHTLLENIKMKSRSIYKPVPDNSRVKWCIAREYPAKKYWGRLDILGKRT